MQTIIRTNNGTFRRTAWTGGDVPPTDFSQTDAGKQLISFFMEDQIADCGGPDRVKDWLFGRQTIEEKFSIFHNRALHDAWATFRAGEVKS